MNKYLLYRVKQMRLMYCKYTKTGNKHYLSLSNQIGNDVDEEITREILHVRRFAQQVYELKDTEKTVQKEGIEWFEEHILESLDYYFCDKQHIDLQNVYENGFFNDTDFPTLVINDMGDVHGDDMIEFRFSLCPQNKQGKIELSYLRRLKS